MGLLKPEPVKVYVDTTAVLDGITNDKIDRTQRYSAIRRGWVKDQVKALLIQLIHCDTNNQLADHGTKFTKGSKSKVREQLLGLASKTIEEIKSIAQVCGNPSQIMDELNFYELHEAIIEVAYIESGSPDD